ncbi:MAG: sulfatase-like hydrolase/transferase [Novosphingobium sp.]|nr:sulfatase-like hydrolase/transferase [Novosphingobium sp.]
MKRRIVFGILALLAVLGAIAWIKRVDLFVWLASFAAKQEDLPDYKPVTWQEGPENPEAPISARAPNIVLILADDLGMNNITAFGGGIEKGLVPTPNIDRIAAQGAEFTDGYAGDATCAPSRAALLTGRYPSRTGFEFTPSPRGTGRIVEMIQNANDKGQPRGYYNSAAADRLPEMEDQGLPGSEVTLAEVLKGVGYHTVHIGKWHLGTRKDFAPNAQGFDESLLQESGLHAPEDAQGIVNAKLDFDPVDRMLWATMQFSGSFNGGPRFKPGGYLTDWWTDEAVKVIHANRNRPFFLYFAHWAPHSPLQATQADYDAVGDIKPHRKRVYAAMVRALDRSVGRVLDALEKDGLDKNTIVLFSSDNGGAGYVGIDGLNNPYRGWKATFFEGGVRVPFFVRWPARLTAGTKFDRPATFVDVLPTLAAAAGASLPKGVTIDGIDLLDPKSRRVDDAIFWQSGYYKSVRQGDWKLQVNKRPDRSWLYNLAEDPTERVDLADKNPQKVAELKALIAKHDKGARTALYPFTLEMPIPVDKTGADHLEPGDEYVYWPN